MSIKSIVITVVGSIIFIAVIVSGTWFGSKAYYDNQKPPIETISQTPTTTTVIKIPSTPPEWDNWQLSPVEITGEMNGYEFLVTSFDGYKKGVKTFTFKAKVPDFKKNILLVNYIGIFGFSNRPLTFSHGVKVEYYRMLIPRLGIGFGLFSTNRESGITAGLIIQI